VNLDARVDQAWRRVAVMAVTGGLVVTVLFLVTTLYLLDQVKRGDRTAECRSKIANAAEVIKADRDTAQSQFVIATQRRSEARMAGDIMAEEVQLRAASEAVNDVERLNNLLEPAMELRAKSVAICSANPDFQTT
jgi:hypothetical protein